MGLYDYLSKYNIEYNTLVNMISDLSKFVDMKTEHIIKQLDELYDDTEYEKYKGE